MSSKKTSSISFRINEKYEKVLRKISEENKTSLNTLANQIFGNYVEFELYAKKFGTLRMSTDTFRRMLDSMDEKNIIENNESQRNQLSILGSDLKQFLNPSDRTWHMYLTYIHNFLSQVDYSLRTQKEIFKDNSKETYTAKSA